MYFKRMELNGFKSFADPVTIEFTEGMTCIVGPNGSGKSNISDAIRWVLGEQSPKMLRGGKMEEVIFAGTQNRKPKGMAEVTLVIDNADHMLPIDYAEVGITRRMYRSGESEYMINRTPCRLRDIRELIMDTGIGVEGYSIIGQGKIADIISNKMDSRREIFEEAAGIVKYRNKKAETQKKLENAGLNLDRVNDIVGEIESRIGGLEKDAQKASEYLDIREKYKVVEINIILKNIEAADQKTQAVRVELEELDKALEADAETRASLEQQLHEMRSRAEELEVKLGEIREEIAKNTEEIHFIESREALNKERSSVLERDKLRIENELASLEDKYARESSNAEEMKRTREEAASEEAKARAAAEEKHAASETAFEKLSEKEKILNDARSVILDMNSRMSAAKAEAAGMENLRQTLKRRAERLIDEEDDGNGLEISEKITDNENDMAELRSDVEDMKEQLADTEKQRAAVTQQLAGARSKIEEIKVSGGKLSARLRLLEELEHAYEGYNGGIKFVMQSSVKGVVGPVGDLLNVPKGWELAIETALGGNFQNVVTETESAAKECIALLKQNRAGRITFLPADTLRSRDLAETSKIQGMAGYLGCAADRVSCKGGYENVVDYLLGKVIVCDNLDNALAMSKKEKALRYVTLEGEHINPAGAITGGAYKNNTANILSRKAEKDKLEDAINKNLADQEAAEKAMHNLEKKLDKNAKELAEIRRQIQDEEMEIASIAKDIEQLKIAERDAKEAERRRLAELSELEKEIAEAEKSIREITKNNSGFEETKAKAEADAQAIAEEAEKLREVYALAQAEENDARVAENSVSVKVKSASEMEARVLEALAEIGADIEARKAALEDIEKQRAEIEGFDFDAKVTLDEKLAQKEELLNSEDSLNEEKTSARKQAESLEEQRVQADSTFYEHQVQRHDADSRMARFDAQTESLKEKLWDEFEMSYAQAADQADPEFVLSRGVRESREYKERMRQLGDVNIGAIEEYRAVKERYEFLTTQRADLLQAMDELQSVIDEMDSIIKARFKESFDAVVENFEASFKELFKGGNARLSMEDPSNPLESAIEIEAQPPGKKLQNMNLLSGGEKTMTAIALMFAVLKAKPTPFCILDEVEAALDEANIECFARYLRNFDSTQFALITHQKATMEYADVLYGVTMPERGITKVLSLKLGDSFDID
ncbi:MAG: chromosome segregation protein SMC [Clostridia bacterium]|nr:chromosome segregation protein SMC [Clostridia bacterium]